MEHNTFQNFFSKIQKCVPKTQIWKCILKKKIIIQNLKIHSEKKFKIKKCVIEKKNLLKNVF